MRKATVMAITHPTRMGKAEPGEGEAVEGRHDRIRWESREQYKERATGSGE